MKAYDSVRREVLHGILIEFGVPMKLVRPFMVYADDVNLLGDIIGTKRKITET
jgi:hypothetical protein